MVSVIITAYNAAATLAETLASVRAQTFGDFEIIVVNDGSTDATTDVLAEQGPPVRAVHQENRGQPAARNAGIRAAEGEWLAFLDADDLWHPEKLARQMALHRARPALHWSYTDTYYFASATGRITGREGRGRVLPAGDVLRPLLLDGFISAVTPVLHRDVFETVGLFNDDPAVRIGEDWEMWLRVAARFPVGAVRAPLAFVRLHPGSMTQAMDLEHGLQSRLRVLRAALARHPALAADVRAAAEANVYAGMGRRALSLGARREALRFFAAALRRLPAHGAAWRYGLAALLPPPLRRLAGRVRQAAQRAGGEAPGDTVVSKMKQSEKQL